MRVARLDAVKSSSLRRQLSLYVPEPLRSVFDTVRAQADLIQHALIPAHATLVRDGDVDDWSVVRARMEALAPVQVELAVEGLQFDDRGGTYLMLVDRDESFARLRASLLADQPGSARVQTPHLTLMHPRNRASFEMSVAELNEVTFPSSIRFDHVVMIEQSPEQPWRIVAASPESG